MGKSWVTSSKRSYWHCLWAGMQMWGMKTRTGKEKKVGRLYTWPPRCPALYLDCSVREKGFPGGSDGKESTCNAGGLGLTPGSGTSPRGGNGGPLQYPCLENPMDRGAWGAPVHGRNKRSHLSHHIFHCLCDRSLACTLTNACDFLLPQLCTKNLEAILACTNLKSRRKKNHGQVTEESAVFTCQNHPSLRQGWRGPHPHQGVLHRLE